MTRPFAFFVACSLKNRVLSRIRRLGRPKYLISALAGLFYLYYVFLRHSHFSIARGSRRGPAEDPGAWILAEITYACILMAVMLLQWLFANPRAALFSEAEIQFLFPAPLSRGALLTHHVAKTQTGILFGTLISWLLFRGLFPDSLFLLITIWLVYSFLYLYRLAVLLAHRALERKGARGLRIRLCISALILLAVCAAFAASRWLYPAGHPGNEWPPTDLSARIAGMVQHGPARYLLAPFRMLVHPAFASGLPQFLLSLVPALLMIAGLYAWIRSRHARLEETALDPRAPRGGLMSTTAANAARVTPTHRRPPFRLAPSGFAPTAIYWKNLAQAGAFSARLAIPALAVLSVLSIVIVKESSGQRIPMMLGSIAAGIMGFLTLMGPIVLRDDLRHDLKNVDLLKTYPLSGRGIVLGEVLAPATILTTLQWVLILFAAFALPDTPEFALPTAHRAAIAAGAALVLPCLTLIGILTQNAIVLLLPGWMQLGREHQKGVEAMGQRLISGLGTILSLAIAAVPAALIFLIAWIAGHRLIGMAVVPVAALLASAALLAEAALGILWLGRLFERFDPARELE